MEIYFIKVCIRWVQKNNVELPCRHSHSILKINSTILCWLTVNNDAEEIYIYIHIYRYYKIWRSFTVDVKQMFFHESLQDCTSFTVDTKSSSNLTISS